MRRLLSAGVLAAAIGVLPGPLAAQDKASAAGASFAGGWTRNTDLSDASMDRGQQGGDGGRGAGGGRNGGGRDGN